MSDGDPKPLMFGYQVARLGTADADIADGYETLMKFAAREGYALGEVFVERDLNHPSSALAALIAASRYTNVQAIAVPSFWDLGRLPRVQQLTKQRLEAEANVPVLVVPQP